MPFGEYRSEPRREGDGEHGLDHVELDDYARVGGAAPSKRRGGREAEGELAGELTGRPSRTRSVSSKGAQRVSNLSQITADRPIFTLSVAADLLGLHPRTLRIYEEKKLVVPARTGGNRRRYSQNDIQRFQFIRRLTQGGVNLEGVRIILDMANELSRLGGDPGAVIERNLRALDED